MRILVVTALLVASHASAQTRGPSADQGEAVGRWITQRVNNARQGTRDLVRLPLAFQSDGWGCLCPTNYVGTDPMGHTGGETWLRVINESGDAFPEIPSHPISDGEGGTVESSEGMAVLVEGYFTGDVHREVLSVNYKYNVSEFVVTRIVRRLRDGADVRVALLSSSQTGVCDRIVQDDSPLNVREHPRGRARTVGQLANGTRVTPVRWRGHRWIRIEAPIAGWVWVSNTRRACR